MYRKVNNFTFLNNFLVILSDRLEPDRDDEDEINMELETGKPEFN